MDTAPSVTAVTPMEVEVRTVTHREGNKNGKPWAMDFVTCIIANPDGTEAMGEFILPKNHPPVTRGKYRASLRAYASEGKIVLAFNTLSSVPAGK